MNKLCCDKNPKTGKKTCCCSAFKAKFMTFLTGSGPLKGSNLQKKKSSFYNSYNPYFVKTNKGQGKVYQITEFWETQLIDSVTHCQDRESLLSHPYSIADAFPMSLSQLSVTKDIILIVCLLDTGMWHLDNFELSPVGMEWDFSGYICWHLYLPDSFECLFWKNNMHRWWWLWSRT